MSLSRTLLLTLVRSRYLSDYSDSVDNYIAVSGNTSIDDPTMCKDNDGTYYLFGMFASSSLVLWYKILIFLLLNQAPELVYR